MKMIIAGGGTGGHLYPGIALARAFQERFPKCEILFIGTQKGIESKILPREGFPLKTIKVEGWVGKKLTVLLGALFRFPESLVESYRLIKEFKPDLVVGVGGYASGPVLLIAALMNVKRIILEQNVIPGLTNKVLGKFVHQVFVSFEGSHPYFPEQKFFYSGNPVRKEILSVSGKKEGEKITILVFGGSQGAHSINQAVVEALDLLAKNHLPSIRWIHQTGPQDLEWVREEYAKRELSAEVEPFIYDMARAYAFSDLVICRAGATTLAELTACGKPAILVPFPFAAHNHQEKNALYMKKMGAAEMIGAKSLSGNTVAERIGEILSSAQKMKEMSRAMFSLGKKEAAELIIERCLSLGLIHV
jgi:UDP-N-acetylglucosamine--N-acetylmuramyl-(pentapeptide) pyrophosphoryl-undecaprenol N-acetylglucosamine transferase